MSRRLHRVLGLVLLLPLVGWAATGFVFFLKPGYEAAYSALRLRTYPLAETPIEQPGAGWLEVRTLRTILGDHVLVRSEKGWAQVDPVDLRRRTLPDEASIRSLIDDALAGDRGRYGEIAAVTRQDGDSPAASIRTTTGVEIELDWSTLALGQSGRDTRRIDALYRVHYLQWTGVRPVDRVLGVVGLAALLVLAGLGVRLAVSGGR